MMMEGGAGTMTKSRVPGIPSTRSGSTRATINNRINAIVFSFN